MRRYDTRSLDDSAGFRPRFCARQEAVQQMQLADVLLLVIPDQQPNKHIGKDIRIHGLRSSGAWHWPHRCDAAPNRQTGSGAFFGCKDGRCSGLLESPAGKVAVAHCSRPAQAEALEAVRRSVPVSRTLPMTGGPKGENKQSGKGLVHLFTDRRSSAQRRRSRVSGGMHSPQQVIACAGLHLRSDKPSSRGQHL